MEILVTKEEGISIVSIAGEINEQTTMELREKLDSMVKGGDIKIIIDLSQTSFISSAGLATFAFCHKQLKGKGSLKFASLPRHIYNLFKLTYMNKVVDIFEDLETALKSFQVQ